MGTQQKEELDGPYVRLCEWDEFKCYGCNVFIIIVVKCLRVGMLGTQQKEELGGSCVWFCEWDKSSYVAVVMFL